MKENKAIKSVLNKAKARQDSGNFMDKFNVEEQKAVIKALKEVQKYRDIGTPKECRSAVEKQTAKKPIDRCLFMECPTCGSVEIQNVKYCPECGQKINSEWDLSEKRRKIDEIGRELTQILNNMN